MAVLKVVNRARGRLLRNALLAQGANAFTAALSAFILLLLFGAELLSWRWLIPVPLAAAAAGAYRAWRRLPSLYRTAQIVDRRMGLADALATAIFFSGTGRPRCSSEMRRCQLERAEAVSRTVDARRAVPYTFPRAAYASAALFLVASSLFALRYAVTRRLDLKPPLAAILKLDLGLGQRIQEAKAIADPPPQPESTQAQDAQSADDDRTRRETAGAQRQAAPQSGERSKTGRDGDGKKSEDSSARDREQTEEQSQASGDPREQQQNPQSAENRQSGQNGTDRQEAPQKTAASQRSGDNEGSSLMDKFRDAVQNILSRVKPQQQGGRQQQSDPARAQSQGNRQQNNAAQEQARTGRQQQSGEGQGNSGERDAGRSARNDAAAQRQAGTPSDAQSEGKQPGSGIGNEDGNKEIKQAEQLAAMGKISEILGKRAASLSGEATVEVQSSNQQLRTPYADRAAQHSATGAEIGRDEVPLALQSYIEHYFDQVRKQKK